MYFPYYSTVCVEDSPGIDLRVLLLARRSVVVFGVTNSYSCTVESVAKLRRRISQALLYVPAERLTVKATDVCV